MDYSSLWDIRIVLDLLVGGVGVGMFLCAAFSIWGRRGEAERTFRVSMLVSVALVTVGALILVSELGKPFNLASTLIGFNASSVTSWGGVLQGSFIVFGIIMCVMSWKRGSAAFDSAAFKVIGAIETLLAVLVLIYHGLVLNSLGRGLWADAMVVPLFALSSLIAGGASLLLVDCLCDKYLDSSFAMPLVAVSLGLVVFFAAYGFTVASAGADALYCYQAMMASSGAVWWIGGLLVGAIVPLALCTFVLFSHREWSMSLVVVLAVCAIAGSAALKIVLASTVQIVIG